METIFWISIATVIYTFFGYAIVISLLAKLKSKKTEYTPLEDQDLPEVTLLIAAYNEEGIIEDKIRNSLALHYPADKLKILFVTDGSDDNSLVILRREPEIEYSHSPQRRGKIAAINRVMSEVKTPITIFTDANVMLNPEALKNLVNHFQSNLVAAVSGEKVVLSPEEDAASGTGEGAYWKYESFLKRKDAEWNSLVGSAGELVAIRTHLFTPTPENTIIEDFVMTVSFALDGYRVAYEPKALAVETASANVEEEEKRKVRISAGGIQAIFRLPSALNVIKFPSFGFQYISHRVLRWTLVPLALVVAFFASFLLIETSVIYLIAFIAQGLFYSMALFGYAIRNRNTRWKILHIPYYFTFMQVCVMKGWLRYAKGKQSVTWEKAKRAEPVTANLQEI